MNTTILEDVAEALDKLASDPAEANRSNSDWTKQIKQQCQIIARSRECKIYASSLPGSDGGEWLFDVSLMRWSEQTGVEEFALALESEWIQKDWEIENDFLKLVVCRADSRVMVFQANTVDRAKKHFGELRRLVDSFPSSEKGDQYLLSSWVTETRGFEHERITV